MKQNNLIQIKEYLAHLNDLKNYCMDSILNINVSGLDLVFEMFKNKNCKENNINIYIYIRDKKKFFKENKNILYNNFLHYDNLILFYIIQVFYLKTETKELNKLISSVLCEFHNNDLKDK